MPIDFSQVNTITIPEGSVTKITDSNGNTLWQGGGQSEGWHTIWEGNKTCSLTKKGTAAPVISGAKENLAQTAVGTGYTPKIRITFSYSNTNTGINNWTNSFVVNGSNQTTISSPVTIDAINKPTFFEGAVCLVTCRYYEGDTAKVILGAGLKSKTDTNNNRVNISLKGHGPSNDSHNGDFTITFTVTKIEQYY